MKKTLTVIILASIVTLWAGEKGHEGHEGHGEHKEHSQNKDKGHHDKTMKDVSITGEVMDLTCFISHPKDGQGKDHAKCAQKCIKEGLPVGIKTDDGTLYLAAGKGHSSANEKLAPFAGKKVTVTGVIKEENGMKLILVETVAAK